MITLTDINPVFLDCQISNGAIVLTHGGTPLPTGELELRLVDQSESVVAVNDFEQDGVLFRVSAFTKLADGTNTPWDRTSEGVRSPTLTHGGDHKIVVRAMVTATSYALAGEFTARELESFEQKSSYTPADVDVHLPSPEDIKPGT